MNHANQAMTLVRPPDSKNADANCQLCGCMCTALYIYALPASLTSWIHLSSPPSPANIRCGPPELSRIALTSLPFFVPNSSISFDISKPTPARTSTESPSKT